jgi:hypothetical protein
MLTAALVLVLAQETGAPSARDLTFSDPQWKHGDPKARVEMLDGRQALRLTTGLSTRRDVLFTNGTIEFDLWSTGERAFAYVHFRMQDDRESESIYFRLHKSRLPDAVQYEPVYQGLANWQLFHGPDSTAAAELKTGQWTHVRLVVSGEKAAVFVGAATTPTLIVPKLARGTRGGYVGLRSFLGANVQAVAEPPSSFANLVVKPDVIGFDFSSVPERPVVALPGLVTKYRLGAVFSPGEGPVRALPAEPRSEAPEKVVAADSSGLVVLGRELIVPTGMRRYATSASFRVKAASAGVKRMKLGFSDEASVFLNGRILYSGDQRYSFNFPRQEGLIHLDQASVYLPLLEGENEVHIVISEVFGGWGVMAQFDDPTGLSIEP